MRRGRYKRAQVEQRPQARSNEQISVPEVRVIDAQGGQLGILPTNEAIAQARAQGLDLVEVAPKANPPVAKLINYDKYRYQLEKQARQQRKHQKKIDVKGIRLSVRTGEHDLKVKAQRSEKFLKDGDKVKIEIFLRGRERANPEQASEKIKTFLQLITLPYQLEQKPQRLGYVISAIISTKQS